jgi:hypothetical protein
MSRPLIRFFAAALVAVSGLALTAVAFDAEAARAGKGGNSGRQSSNVTSQLPRQATRHSVVPLQPLPPVQLERQPHLAPPVGWVLWLVLPPVWVSQRSCHT